MTQQDPRLHEPRLGSVHAFGCPDSPRNGHVYHSVTCCSRYNGGYSKGLWHCWPVGLDNTDLIPDEAYGSDIPCGNFWSEQIETSVPIVGKGRSQDKAHQNLVDQLVDFDRIISNQHDRRPTHEIPGLKYFIDRCQS